MIGNGVVLDPITFRKEIEALRRQPNVPTKKSSLSEHTAITSLETFDRTHAPQDDVRIDSPHLSHPAHVSTTIPEHDGWIIEGVDIELDGNAKRVMTGRAARRHSMPTVDNKIKHRATKEAECRRKSEELLVDFGLTQRRRRDRWCED